MDIEKLKDELRRSIAIDEQWLKQEYEDTARLTPSIARHEGRVEAMKWVLERLQGTKATPATQSDVPCETE